MGGVRVLALADEPPPRPIPELVADLRPELILLLGDLEPAWTEGLAAVTVPKIGVHGNHDLPGALADVGAGDAHLRRLEAGGLTFSGFAGSPRYSRDGRFEWTQEEAERLIAGLPGADVLLTHSPPAGVNDDPSDRVHSGSNGAGAVAGAPPPRVAAARAHPASARAPRGGLGPTRVVHVRGVAALDL